MKNFKDKTSVSNQLVEKTKKIFKDYKNELPISTWYWNVSTPSVMKKVNYFEYYSMYHHSTVMRSVNFYKPIITIINYE